MFTNAKSTIKTLRSVGDLEAPTDEYSTKDASRLRTLPSSSITCNAPKQTEKSLGRCLIPSRISLNLWSTSSARNEVDSPFTSAATSTSSESVAGMTKLPSSKGSTLSLVSWETLESIALRSAQSSLIPLTSSYPAQLRRRWVAESVSPRGSADIWLVEPFGLIRVTRRGARTGGNPRLGKSLGAHNAAKPLRAHFGSKFTRRELLIAIGFQEFQGTCQSRL